MRLRIDSRERQLDTLFSVVEKQTGDEVKAHLTRYLCIQTSGLLENVVKELIISYASGSSPRQIESFVTKSIKNLTNLNADKLSHFLASFDKEWGRTFNEKLSERQKIALNSVVSNRNSIAHGNQDNISFSYMKGYYEDIKVVISILKEIIRK